MRLLGITAASLVVALSGAVAPQAAQRCPTTLTHKAYVVEGATFDDLRVSMRTHGPVDDRGVRRYASTEWKVKWEWEKNERDIIDPATVSVRCAILITLPEIAPTTVLSATDTVRWDDLLKRLRAHEDNHAHFVQERAPEITRRIEELHRQRGAVYVSDGNRIAREVLQEIRNMDHEYDERTDHGKREGV